MRLLLALLFAVPCFALPDTPLPKIETKYVMPKQPINWHQFMDKPAKIAAFSTLALLAADSAITCDNLAHGGHEDWLHTQKCGPAVAQLSANKLAFWGLAYVAHRTHHHKIERAFEWMGPAWSAAGISYSVRNGAF